MPRKGQGGQLKAQGKRIEVRTGSPLCPCQRTGQSETSGRKSGDSGAGQGVEMSCKSNTGPEGGTKGPLF